MRSGWRPAAAAGALVLCGALGCSTPPPTVAEPGPIVIVSIDTLRADRLPAYGYRSGRTPAIDRLARDGTLFERAYTHSPLTLPAHTSMLSGLLPQRHGVRDNVGFEVPSSVRLLPAWLRERGYATAGIVSSAVLREETGIGAGFDLFDGRMPTARGGAALDEAQRDGHESLAIARRWLDRQPSRAFFLFLHLYEPHAPYSPPERFAGLSAYDGEVAYADEIVGALLEVLRGRGAYDDATIVLLSDHGEGLGDHGEQEHGLFLYEEAVRVPLIVKLPRQQRAGSRVAALVQHVDLLPTLLDLAGVPQPGGLPGRSLRPLLEGRTDGWPERSVYSETLFGRYHFGWSELLAVTDRRFRFIQAPRPELYDFEADPRERRNAIEARRATAAAMGRALAQLASGAPVESPTALAPEVRDRLASLGYVGPQSDGAARPAGGPLPDPKDKVDVLTRYRTAMAHASAGRLGEAIDLLREIGRAEPGMADVWLTAGRLLQRAGRRKEAVQTFREYVKRKPSSAAGLLELAGALLALERFGDAATHAELAASVAAPRDTGDRLAAHEMLVRIALARGDGGAARRHAAEAGRVDPAFPLPDYVEGRLAYSARRYADALAHFARATRARRSHPVPIRGLHLYAGDTLAHLERFAEAEGEFREEIRLFPESTAAYLSLANLYEAFGRTRDADLVLETLLRAAPSAEAAARAARIRAGRAAGGTRVRN